MKIIMIECNAEEIKANRTLFDSITDAVSGFVSNMRNSGITPEMLAALHTDADKVMVEDEESEDNK